MKERLLAILLACGMPEGVLSLLLAAYMLTSFGGAFFWGRLCDRKETNRRIFLPVFFSATLLSALAFLAAGRSLLLSSFLYLALGFLVSSLGTNLDAWMLRSFRHDSAMYGRARGTGSAGYAAAMLVGGQLIRLFGAANESVYYTAFAVKTFRIYLCMIPLACVNKASFIYLQALGKAVLSTVLSMIREVAFGVLLPIILPLFFGLDGILYSMPAADIMTFVITCFAIAYIFSILKEPEGAVSLS